MTKIKKQKRVNREERIYKGTVNIGDLDINCAVNEDGLRVIGQTALNKAFSRPEGGAGKLPVIIDLKSLEPFISEDVRARANQLIEIGEVKGFEASLLPDICEIWLKARDAGVLTEKQLITARKADLIMRALSAVGIAALVDEATGYQNVRSKDALQKILDTYLNKEFATWARRFPDDFYREMFRLRGWNFDQPNLIKRPGCVGNYTNDIVYDRLAPGIVDELRKRNPKNEKGATKARDHQLLTEDIGIPALGQHLHTVIAFMKASTKWDDFKRMLERALPKKNAEDIVSK
jgi:hypothetical protein